MEPHRHVHLHQRWYLLGWDIDKEDWRVFRLDRLSELRSQSRRFSLRPLPAGTGIDYLREGINKHRQRVVLTIDAPMTAVAEAFTRQDVVLTASAGGGTRAVLMLDCWQWLLPALAFLDVEFTVEEPEEFRAALRQFGAHLVRDRPPVPPPGSGSITRPTAR
ncbi:hypothetical protein GCM10020221_18790 [Streptomyces thioluteus]|uniref:WYL domain-containing protein n=1 Tax=Streptomyces thioluteus TaxID=66431 RepID=A0ABP6J659_STRTU